MTLRLALVLLLFLPIPSAAAEVPALLVTIGDVTDTSAVVWARGQTWGRLTVRYALAAGGGERREEIKVSPTSNLTGKVLLRGLEPASRYRYAVSQNSHDVQGEFAT